MAPIRPEFFYHPVVGVVSPTSLGLLSFKPGPLVVSPPLNNPPLPKPLNRVAVPAAAEPTVMNTTSQIALTEAAPNLKENKEDDVKKIKRDPSGTDVCIVTGEEKPLAEMIRFVAGPDNIIVADLTEKLPGNSFWVTASRDIVKKAIWRNSFTTANRAPVTVPKNLIEQVQLGLLRQSLETIGLAKKAGLLVQGFAKVEEVLKEGRADLYIVASDAKENGREKLEKLARAKNSVPVIEAWTSSQLSASVGVENAVHLALTPGSLTEKLKNLAQKLKNFN